MWVTLSTSLRVPGRCNMVGAGSFDPASGATIYAANSSIQIERSDPDRLKKFLGKWKGSQGNERANYQTFFGDLCKALAVDEPPPKGNVVNDPYCFDKDVKIPHPNGSLTTNYADFYKAEHFLIEAKQGSNISNVGTAKRGTPSYNKAMEKAFVQALTYARNLDSKPPFLLTCDIGSHFELWTGFSGDYGGYGARKIIPLTDLEKPKVLSLFVDIFTAPQKRNPEKISAEVTREVAAELAKLARSLERQCSPAQVAQFLMRCVFTMFCEDAGLLKDLTAPSSTEKIFTGALEDRWQHNPATFKPQVEALWKAMNEGTGFGFIGKLLKFNGGLFADATALDLSKEQLQILLNAAKQDWTDVEPAIFGTLLERALDPKERSKLGAHYTPRSYVERLIRPVVIQPLREEWELVQAEVKQLLDNGDGLPTEAQKRKAIALLEEFLQHLRTIKILDPACGTGNFLYVTLDLLKSLESEVLRRLEDLTGQAQLRLDLDQVNPSQFLGIEINPRAAAIADLVIWIGYLQWHFKQFGDLAPAEPVLREYKNIECRDAVLAYDGKEPDVDPKTGKVRTRWGGRMMKHPVTGKNVPDPSDQIPIYRYINPRSAEWQEADYVVSNPPFIGNARMRARLGEGYTETLRQVYSDVPETVDFVMYWWHKAAELTRAEKVERFGFITTNSIRQPRLRSVIDFHCSAKDPLQLVFAIPDHPWADEGAAVRISMTVSQLSNFRKFVKFPQVGIVVDEGSGLNPEDSADQIQVRLQNAGRIFSSLQFGTDVTKAISLRSNLGLGSQGYVVGGSGFVINDDIRKTLDQAVVHSFITGRDVSQISEQRFVIDVNHLAEEELRLNYPKTYQWLLETVKPERDINNDLKLRREWWKYRRSNISIRDGVKELNRYIATTRTAKHRVFQFFLSNVMAESGVIMLFLEDAYYIGILSSKLHITWTLAQGSVLEDRPVYNHASCFYTFPFPDPTPKQKQKIRELGDRLDSHRKRVQSQHPEVTITAMYNLLEKIRAGEPLTDNDREFNNKALVSTLKQIHDELDAAVFAAYGWEDLQTESRKTKDEVDEIILKRLVALNAERAEEERNGLIRWLRPDYQAPHETYTQQTIAGVTDTETIVIEPAEQKVWPKKPREQLTAIRDLLQVSMGEWTLDQVTAQFKGAQRHRQTIADHLESLEELGILLSRTDAGVTHWNYAELQKSA